MNSRTQHRRSRGYHLSFLQYFLCTAVFMHMLCHIPSSSCGNANNGINISTNQSSNNSARKRSLAYDRNHDIHIDSNNQEGHTASTQAEAKGCQACRMRDEMRSLSLDTIKKHILAKLGFKHAPNTTGRTLPKLPPNLMDYYKERRKGSSGSTGSTGIDDSSDIQNDDPTAGYQTGPVVIEEDDDYHSRTDLVLAFAQHQPRLRHSWKGQSNSIQFFKFNDKIMENEVKEATLHIFIKGTEFPSQQITSNVTVAVSIEVSKILKVSSKSDSPTKESIVTQSIMKPLGRGAWLDVDVTSMVADWFRTPRNNMGTEIKVVDANGKRAVVLDHEVQRGSLIPFIKVKTFSGRKRRRKRSLGIDCNETSEEVRCCRYPLIVNFEDFGWDWVIAPKEYEAYYCSGECPYVFLQDHPHTHIVHLAEPKGSAGPCCAPRKMSSMDMLYFDQDFNIVYGTLPGMVVDRCGCS